MRPTLKDFKLFLIAHDLSLEPAYRLVFLCPKILEKYTFDDIIMTVPFLALSLKPVSKTITISPIVYNSVILDAMKHESAIMAHISSILVNQSNNIIQKELLHQFKMAYAKLTRS